MKMRLRPTKMGAEAADEEADAIEATAEKDSDEDAAEADEEGAAEADAIEATAEKDSDGRRPR